VLIGSVSAVAVKNKMMASNILTELSKTSPSKNGPKKKRKNWNLSSYTPKEWNL